MRQRDNLKRVSRPSPALPGLQPLLLDLLVSPTIKSRPANTHHQHIVDPNPFRVGLIYMRGFALRRRPAAHKLTHSHVSQDPAPISRSQARLTTGDIPLHPPHQQGGNLGGGKLRAQDRHPAIIHTAHGSTIEELARPAHLIAVANMGILGRERQSRRARNSRVRGCFAASAGRRSSR